MTTALDRAMQMMTVPMKDLPPLAAEYARHLCQRYGGCMEVFLTAYAAYAQCVEGLEPTDPDYAAGPDAWQWFADQSDLPVIVQTPSL